MKTLIITTLAIAAFALTAGQANASYGGSGSSNFHKGKGKGKGKHSQYQESRRSSCYPMSKSRHVSSGFWAGSSGNDSCYRPSRKEKCHQKQNWENKRDKNMCHKQKFSKGKRQKGSSSSWDHSRDARRRF